MKLFTEGIIVSTLKMLLGHQNKYGWNEIVMIIEGDRNDNRQYVVILFRPFLKTTHLRSYIIDIIEIPT